MKMTSERAQQAPVQTQVQVYGQSVALFQISMTLSDRFHCSDFQLVAAGDGVSTLTMWIYGDNIWDAVIEALEAEVEFDYEGGILYAT